MTLLRSCIESVPEIKGIEIKKFILERSLLQSLACRDEAQALSVLEEMEMLLPVRSELFRNVLILTYKLRNEHIDYAHEIKTAVGELDDEESI